MSLTSSIRKEIYSLPGTFNAGRSLDGWALEFDDTKQHHVNHGHFLLEDTDYNAFAMDFMIKPTGGQYFLSPGEGGNHAPALVGVSGNSTTGYEITGNLAYAGSSTNLPQNSGDRIRHDKWAFVSVVNTGSLLLTYINGVPSAVKSYSGGIRLNDLYEAVLYVAGSDHQGFKGRKRGFRIFMGDASVYPSAVAFRPPVENFEDSWLNPSSVLKHPVFIAPYYRGHTEDTSLGFTGRKHHGFLAEASGGFLNGLYNRDVSKLPKWVVDPWAWPTEAAAQKTQISGSRIYDDLSRPDVHYGTSATLGMGTTRIGGKVWAASNYGILNGLAFCGIGGNNHRAIITDAGTVDKTIVWRRPIAGMGTGVGATYRFVYQSTDANNYNDIFIDEYGTCQVRQVVGGTATAVGANLSAGTSWTEVRAVISASGTSVDARLDGSSIGTRTISANTAATSCGFELTHPVLRVSEFAVV